MQIRGRSWVFTINNFDSSDLDKLTALDCQYLIYGFERGSAGTPHLQGFVHFANARTRRSLAANLPRAYLDKRRGTVQQAIDYCKKDGVFIERGTPPIDQETALLLGRQRANETHREIISRAEKGDFEWIKQNYPAVWIARMPSLRSMFKPPTAILDGDLLHEWWYGPTGCGKSSTVWGLYPTHYQKQLNKWWDGYDSEAVVVIEEWSPKNEISGSQLKIWADRYPFPGQIKGGTLQRARPQKIIVLSNYSIAECFTESQDRDPILRRFTQIRFPEDMELATTRAQLFHSVHASAPSNSVELSSLPVSPRDVASHRPRHSLDFDCDVSTSNATDTDALTDQDIASYLDSLIQ